MQQEGSGKGSTGTKTGGALLVLFLLDDLHHRVLFSRHQAADGEEGEDEAGARQAAKGCRAGSS